MLGHGVLQPPGGVFPDTTGKGRGGPAIRREAGEETVIESQDVWI